MWHPIDLTMVGLRHGPHPYVRSIHLHHQLTSRVWYL